MLHSCTITTITSGAISCVCFALIIPERESRTTQDFTAIRNAITNNGIPTLSNANYSHTLGVVDACSSWLKDIITGNVYVTLVSSNRQPLEIVIKNLGLVGTFTQKDNGKNGKV